MTDNLPAIITSQVPATVTAGLAIVPTDPTVTEVLTVTSWIVNLGTLQATVSYANDEPDSELRWSRVYVDNALAYQVDAELAELARQEEELGDDRFLPRDIDPEVDAFYDRLNARYAENNTTIALVVLPLLDAVLDGSGRHSRRLDNVEFSPYAGCTTCKCTPGVKAPRALRHGSYVRIQIAATPSTEA